MKRLYSSEKDKQVSGVSFGIAEYPKLDPTLVRVGYVLLTVLIGVFPGVTAYTSLWQS